MTKCAVQIVATLTILSHFPIRITRLMITRRHFLTTSLSALGASALPAIEPIKRSGPGQMELGVAAYGFRDYFEWSRTRRTRSRTARLRMSIIDFIDWCADQGVPGAELTSYFFPPDTDTAFCEKVRAHADKRGVRITGSAIGNTYTNPPGEKRDEQLAYTKKWVDFCAILGAPHIRVFAGPAPKGMSLEDGVKNCIETYQMALDYAATKKIFLGIENHGGVVAEPEQLIAIIAGGEERVCRHQLRQRQLPHRGPVCRPRQDRALHRERAAQGGHQAQGRCQRRTQRHPTRDQNPARRAILRLVHPGV